MWFGYSSTERPWRRTSHRRFHILFSPGEVHLPLGGQCRVDLGATWMEQEALGQRRNPLAAATRSHKWHPTLAQAPGHLPGGFPNRKRGFSMRGRFGPLNRTLLDDFFFSCSSGSWRTTSLAKPILAPFPVNLIPSSDWCSIHLAKILGKQPGQGLLVSLALTEDGKEYIFCQRPIRSRVALGNQAGATSLEP